jgi:hypothetical protein
MKFPIRSFGSFRNLRSLALVSSLSAAVLLSACGGGGSSVGQGTLSASLTDAPACGFDQVNITVSKLRAHQSSSANENDTGWSEITLDPAIKVNLLDLSNGVLKGLGQTTLPAGHYTQLRLVLSPNAGITPLANSVVPSGGAETALVTPSGIQSGIKIIGGFDIAANSTTDIALDFDACKSIVTRGNGSYGLKPVISMIPMATTGGIDGVVDPALVASQPVVTAQVDGVVVKSTVPDSTGAFSLSPLTAGTYTVVVTANAHASDVIAGVPVTAQGKTAVSTSATPLTMPTSASNTVSGTILPIAAEGTARATQSFAGSSAVTISYKAADVTTGDYSLALPTGAPMLGQFGTLPIVFGAQTAAAGKYSVEASASGYQTQTSSIDVSAGNVTQNFTLQQ